MGYPTLVGLVCAQQPQWKLLFVSDQEHRLITNAQPRKIHDEPYKIYEERGMGLL